ncbi:MAG: DUF6538 domain-containing protein, partial [Verrucomicrobiales bacterium]
ECGGLENRCSASYRGFESHPLCHMPSEGLIAREKPCITRETGQKMGHRDETQIPFSMPQPRRRKSSAVYQLRQRIPTELVNAGIYGKKKEFKKSLRTTDLKVAKRLALTVAQEWHVEWERELRKLKPSPKETAQEQAPVALRPLSSLSELEWRDFVKRHFIGLEMEAEEKGRDYDWGDDDDGIHRSKAIYEAKSMLMILKGDSSLYDPIDWHAKVVEALREEGIEVDEKSKKGAFIKVCKLFKRAYIETQTRTIKSIDGDTAAEIDPHFKGIGAYSALPAEIPASSPTPVNPAKQVTIGDFCERYIQSKLESNQQLSFGWQSKAETHAQVLKTLWGEDKPLSSVTAEDARNITSFLGKLPTNASKRYAGLPLTEATERESRKKNPKLLSPKTQRNYFDCIKAMFNFALEMDWIERNPFTRKVVSDILPRVELNSRSPMTTSEINKIFTSEDYLKERKSTDGKVGEQARFWVPLLCLFHSLRSNEACQLLLEDITQEDGIWVVNIRQKNDAGESVKKLKTQASVRKIPLHSELKKMGFLEYMESQKERGEIDLFPELKASKSGSKNDALGKWFARLSKKQLKDLPGSVGSKGLHTLRHSFTRAMRDGGVSKELRDILGGWSDGVRKNSESVYGDGFSLQTLAEAVEKVKFPDVDFSPIYAGRKSV